MDGAQPQAGENFLHRNRLTGPIFDRPRLVLGITIVGVAVLLSLMIWYLQPMEAKWFVLAFYIYGAIPFAFIFTYLVKGKEIDKYGSTNVSLSNSFRVGGWAVGILTLVGEISKAVLPLAVSWYFFNYEAAVSAALVFSSILGTFYSPFLRFKGGLGTTIMIWAYAFLAPVGLLVVLALGGVLYLVVRDTYYFTLGIFWIAPVVAFLFGLSPPLVALPLAYAIIYTIRYNRRRDELAHGVKVAKDA
jgi:acyl phosphate:glycerol-3-phosphate acyltransferase